MVASPGVIDHYGTTSLLRRIDEALRRAGLVDRIIGWADLTPLDQFHVRGLAATRELAEALGLDVGASVLDLGCGLGGPARFLAATYGCPVTGIDLSQTFIEAARMLTERPRLAMTLDHAAEAYAGQAHYAEAEEFYGKVLAILTPRLGSDNPVVQRVLAEQARARRQLELSGAKKS